MKYRNLFLIIAIMFLFVVPSISAQLGKGGEEESFLPQYPLPPPPDLTWIDTDWSIAGSYQEAEDVDPTSSPGELVLESDPREFIQLFHATPLVPFYNNYRKDSIFDFKQYSLEPHRIYYALSSSLDGGCDPHNNLPLGECELSEIGYYDMTTDSRGTAFPQPWELPEPAVLRLEEFNGKLYSLSNDRIERYAGCPHESDCGSVYVYDHNVGHWQVNDRVLAWPLEWNSPIQGASHYAGIEEFQGKLYAIGGNSASFIGYVFESVNGGLSWTMIKELVGSRMPRAIKSYQGKLFIKATIGNRMDVFDGINWETITLPGVGSYYIYAYAKFRVANDKLFLLQDTYMFMLNGVNNQWQYLGTTDRWDIEHPENSGPPPYLVSWGSGPMGFNVFGDYIYVAGIVNPYSQGGGSMRTPQLWKMSISSGEWEMVNPQVTDDERLMRLRNIENLHGRILISDSRTPNVDPDDGLYPRIFAAKCEDEGYLISSVHDFDVGMVSGTIEWDQIVSPGTLIKFQLRSGRDLDEINSRDFVGPDGTDDTYYTVSSTPIDRGHRGDNLLQYKAFLEGADDGRLMPVLDEVRIEITGKTTPPGNVSDTQ